MLQRVERGVLPAVLQRVKGEDAEKSNRWLLRVKREDVEGCYNEWRDRCGGRYRRVLRVKREDVEGCCK